MDSTMPDMIPASALDISFEKIMLVGLVIASTYAVAWFLRTLLDRLADRLPHYRLALKRMQPILRISIYAGAAYLTIRAINPEEKALYAMLGSMALALGLAAKDLLNDLIGGFVVLFDRSFQIGDRVSVGGYYGEVVGIGLRSIKLVTPDDSLVTVPNSTVLANGVSNTNAGATDCQVVVDIYLPASVPVDAIEVIAHEAVLTSKLAYLNKPVVVNVKDEFEETHITHLIVKAYVFDTRHESAFAADLTRRIKKEIARRGLLPPDSRFAKPVVGKLLEDDQAQSYKSAPDEAATPRR